MNTTTSANVTRWGRGVAAAIAVAAMVSGCATAPSLPADPQASAADLAKRANPASEHCVTSGGKLNIITNGAGGQYGVCNFPDNRQCEEWSMMRGDCPAGGVRVTGYVTPAARFCAITGGTYTVTGNSNRPEETGTCALASGAECDAKAYYDGRCGS